ncbi:MAG: ComEC/Rec2 family competence protein, partial [Verrucomicrobiales bacterium]
FLPGFQLSFTVLLSLTLLHRPIMALLSPLVSPDPFLPQSLLSDAQRLYYKIARGIAEMFAVSVAAWLGSLPLMVYYFHLVTPIAPIANLLLIPIAFCILGTAILSTIASATGLITLSSVLNNANFLWATTLTGAAGFFAGLPVPLSHFYTGPPSVLRPACEITVLDLPRGGACTLISTRHGDDWLIDTGSASDFRPTVAAVLHQHAGVTHLDGTILTHADAAHIGGTSEVIASFRPDLIRPPLKNNSSSSYRSLAARLDVGDLRTITPGRDEAIGIGDGCKITTLYQPDGDRRPRLSDDACSVFLLESNGWRILFTGDAGFDTEKILLATERDNLRADLMIRGSHSSDFSSTPDFLAAVQPAATIVNARNFEDDDAGEQAWRHAMDQAGVVLFDQEMNGAISIRIDAVQPSISSFKSDQFLILKRAR